MLQNVLSRAQIILKEAGQKLPVEAIDDIKQVYREITKLNTYLNKEVDRFLTIEPPHGGRVGADCHANVFHFAGAIYNSIDKESDTINRLVHTICEAEELHVP